MMEASSRPKSRRFSFWALGFGLATLTAGALEPAVHGLPVVQGLPLLKWLVLGLALATLLLARTARAYAEDRRLYVAAVCLGAIGLLFKYIVPVAILFGLFAGAVT